MSSISNKIKEIIHYFGLNNYSFSKKIGVTPTTVDSIVNGRLQQDGTRKKTKPGFDVLQSIVDEFNINPYFLFGKDENMLKKEGVTYEGFPKVITVNSEGNENIVFIPAKAKAGYLNGYGDIDFVESLPTFEMPHLRNGSYRCFEVEGNSMYPNFSQGDLVFGKYVENLSDIKDDKVYVVISKEDGIVLKRAINQIKESNQLILKSDNTNGEYPSYSIEAKNIMEVWEVTMFASNEIPRVDGVQTRLNLLESQLVKLRESMK